MEAGLVPDQLLFPVSEPELGSEGSVRDCTLIGFSEGAHKNTHPALKPPVVRQRHEARTEHGCQRPLSEHQAPAAQLVVEHRLRRLGQLVGKQTVVKGDGVLHAWVTEPR